MAVVRGKKKLFNKSDRTDRSLDINYEIKGGSIMIDEYRKGTKGKLTEKEREVFGYRRKFL